MEFYKLRPFGFFREAQLYGTLAALIYNSNRTSGKPKTWTDFFPVLIEEKDGDGRDSNERIIELFRQYNLERGHDVNGRKSG